MREYRGGLEQRYKGQECSLPNIRESPHDKQSFMGSLAIHFKEKRVRQSDSLEVKHIVSWKNRVTEVGYILFKGFTTLSSPSIFNAKHSFNRSPNSPLGQPFLSNHSKYSSGKSISTLPAYLPNGICILASLIRFSFSNINEARLRHLTQEYHQRCSLTS